MHDLIRLKLAKFRNQSHFSVLKVPRSLANHEETDVQMYVDKRQKICILEVESTTCAFMH